MSNPNSETSPGKLTAAELEQQATRLRISGATWHEIGDSLGVSHEGARKAVQRALKKSEQQTAELGETLREMERLRLERLMLAVMPAATKGHIGAVDQARKISESLRKLYGLDLDDKNKRPIINLLNVEGLENMLSNVYGKQ